MELEIERYNDGYNVYDYDNEDGVAVWISDRDIEYKADEYNNEIDSVELTSDKGWFVVSGKTPSEEEWAEIYLLIENSILEDLREKMEVDRTNAMENDYNMCSQQNLDDELWMMDL